MSGLSFSAVSALAPVGSRHGHSMAHSAWATKITGTTQRSLPFLCFSGDATLKRSAKERASYFYNYCPKFATLRHQPPAHYTYFEVVFFTEFGRSRVVPQVQSTHMSSEGSQKGSASGGKKKKVQPRRIQLLPRFPKTATTGASVPHATHHSTWPSLRF